MVNRYFTRAAFVFETFAAVINALLVGIVFVLIALVLWGAA
jgi:hypothetical protein